MPLIKQFSNNLNWCKILKQFTIFYILYLHLYYSLLFANDSLNSTKYYLPISIIPWKFSWKKKKFVSNYLNVSSKFATLIAIRLIPSLHTSSHVIPARRLTSRGRHARRIELLVGCVEINASRLHRVW